METTDGRLKFKQGRKINYRTYHCVGFLPKNYIRSGALSKSLYAVSLRGVNPKFCVNEK